MISISRKRSSLHDAAHHGFVSRVLRRFGNGRCAAEAACSEAPDVYSAGVRLATQGAAAGAKMLSSCGFEFLLGIGMPAQLLWDECMRTSLPSDVRVALAMMRYARNIMLRGRTG
ncbi:hypothetical protein MRX96_035398 [Rhipicephalus microplus]